MAVDNQKVVDILHVDKVTGEAVLTIADHLPWEANEHLLVLQEKINKYLAFIESNELLESYPKAKGRCVRIDIACKFAPSSEGEAFLKKVKTIVQGAGFAFSWSVAAQPGVEEGLAQKRASPLTSR